MCRCDVVQFELLIEMNGCVLTGFYFFFIFWFCFIIDNEWYDFAAQKCLHQHLQQFLWPKKKFIHKICWQFLSVYSITSDKIWSVQRTTMSNIVPMLSFKILFSFFLYFALIFLSTLFTFESTIRCNSCFEIILHVLIRQPHHIMHNEQKKLL